MHSHRAVLGLPTKIKPGDRVEVLRGEDLVTVIDIRKARGRPPRTGPKLILLTTHGDVVVPRDRHLRVIRS